MITLPALEQAASRVPGRPEPAGEERRSSRAGFTLMEIAIAMAVVVIGVMSLFALISGGLDASSKAVADTHAGAFANNVFSGLRAVSLDMSETGGPGKWEDFWSKFESGSTNLLVAAPDAWYGGAMVIGAGRNQQTINVPLSILGDGTVRPLVFRNVPFHDTSLTNIVNVGLRYSCNVASLYPLAGAGSVLWTNRTQVTLKVWEGEFGQTNDASALVFYSEFDNPGDL